MVFGGIAIVEWRAVGVDLIVRRTVLSCQYMSYLFAAANQSAEFYASPWARYPVACDCRQLGKTINSFYANNDDRQRVRRHLCSTSICVRRTNFLNWYRVVALLVSLRCGMMLPLCILWVGSS